jgi:hypothetical protein
VGARLGVAGAPPFAPAAIVRAAAWPIERLAPFGDPDLAAAAADGGGQPGFADAYARALAAERTLLWQTTVGDPRFLTALTIANPPLAERAQKLRGRSAPATRIHRLERTLFRYLARAVGRTEPCDLWAGVTLAPWTEHTSVRPCPAQHAFAPDLRPFQALLRALAVRPQYRRAAVWRANATLARRADGGWSYVARMPGGGLQERSTAPHEAADALLGWLPDVPATLAALALEGSARTSLSPRAVEATLEAFIDAGILVGGLDLPPRFETAWEALALAADQLHGADATAWHGAATQLRRICRTLEERLDELAPAQVATALEAARAVVHGLATRLGSGSIELPRTVLRCDLALPFRIGLGRDLADELGRTLREYERRPTAARALRAALAADSRARVGEGIGLSAAATVPSQRARAAALVPEAAGADDPAAPLGCLLVGLEQPAAMTVRGTFDEVAPVFARYAALVASVDRTSRDALLRWLRDALDELAARHELDIAELAGPCEVNPNALAGPSLGCRSVELWAASAGVRGLVGACVRVDPASGRLLVREAGRERDTALFSFVAADVARGDRVSELLLQTSFRQAPLASFQGSALAESRELRDLRPREAIRLASGAVVRPRRTMLTGDALAALVVAQGAERYVRWQRLAREHGWPSLVRLRWEGEQPMLVPAASPLALEAVFERPPAGATSLAVEDVAGLPWLVDEAGEHHAIELAVPFARSEHAWSRRVEREHDGWQGAPLATGQRRTLPA